MLKDNLLKRINVIHELGKETIASAQRWSHDFGSVSFVESDKLAKFRNLGLSFIGDLYGKEKSFYTEFEKITKGDKPDDVKDAIAILNAIILEIENDWLIDIKSLTSAEIFSDFIEMSEYLLDNSYKDPAAIVIGSVLEEKLRQLSTKKGLDIYIIKNGKSVPFKADQLNTNLSKYNIYNKLDQKQITAWLDLRNNAAHGKYQEYNIEQVKQMKTGVMEFIRRFF